MNRGLPVHPFSMPEAEREPARAKSIRPNAKIRTILYYPLSTGRNFDEIKRIVLALQKADSDGVATPADWRPGDDVIVPTAGSCGTAKERMENQSDDQYCLDWFMCFRREEK